MSSVAELDEKINDIKQSISYRELITKHRGPLDERRLRELNLKIVTYENLKRDMLSKTASGTPVPVTKATPRIASVGTLKAKPKMSESGSVEPAKSKTSFLLSGKEEEKEEKEPESAFKMAGAVKKGMAPKSNPKPEPKLSGKFSVMNNSGKVTTKGSVKAPAPTSKGETKAAMSKPTKALIKQPGKSQEPDELEDVEDFSYLDNIPASDFSEEIELGEDDYEDLYSEGEEL